MGNVVIGKNGECRDENSCLVGRSRRTGGRIEGLVRRCYAVSILVHWAMRSSKEPFRIWYCMP